jgi:uncharacterized membrane protein
MAGKARKSTRGGLGARWLSRIRQRPRFHIAVGSAVVLFAILIFFRVPAGRALLFAFDAGAVTFLGMLVHMFAGAGKVAIRRRAREEDQGRYGVLMTGVSLSVIVLVALGLELHAADAGGLPQILLAGATLMLSWLFMNAMFAVHYAHIFYGDDMLADKCGGLQFPGNDDPDYWDFAYFAIVIGMTFQVSDVQITDRSLRRAVLIQSMIAFFFNVIIIAITVNVVAGKV